MKKRIYCLICSLMATSLIAGCGKQAEVSESSGNASVSDESVSQSELVSDEPIYIVYTNDVHSYIYNTVTTDEGEELPGLRLSNVAAMVKDMEAEGKSVILADAGDEFSGDVYGEFDHGASIVELMNATGYDIAEPGNHDFDFGVENFFERVEQSECTYISTNFHSTVDEKEDLEGTHIFDINGKKVAFVGFITPAALTSSSPIYFQDDKGNFIYTIDGVNGSDELIASVQSAIDEVREEADYVVALAHVGVGYDEVKAGTSSYDIIKNVSGLDAYIDGHSHTVIESELVKDKDGKDVILTQTGGGLMNVGIMELSADGITSKLYDSYDNADEEVSDIEETIFNEVNAQMGEKIAVLEDELYINDPDFPDKRMIRSKELNMGDFVADSMYWYFNDKLDMECDVVVANGGGIRSQLPAGDITYLDAKTVSPFGNVVCLIEASGQEIIDALEMGATNIGEWDAEWDIPVENGGFLQVGGLKYTIDGTIPTSVKTTPEGLFDGVEGEYRVKDVQVYNRETNEYEAIDPEKIYKLGGIQYLMRSSGNGLSMFADDPLVLDYVGEDYLIFAEYMQNFKEVDGYACINSDNSPLSELEGYGVDYENPFGSERINIILE